MNPEQPLDTLKNNTSCSIELEGRALLLVKAQGKLYLYENRCPHTGDSLDPMGDSVVSEDGQLMTCQRHAAQFIASTGECVGGPCQGEHMQPVAFTESGGQLYLD